MPEKEYEKIKIAVEYLNLASNLWLTGDMLFSSAHLAGAAEELSGQYCRSKGLEAGRDWWVKFGNKFADSEVFAGITGEKLAYAAYTPKNSIKHMNPNVSPDQTICLDILEEAGRLIRGAYKNFETLDFCNLLSDDVRAVIEKTTIYVEVNS